MPKVLVSDKLSEDVIAIFNSRGVSTDFRPGMGSEELAREIHCYDGLAVRSATKVTKELIEGAKNLKVIGRAGIGVDNRCRRGERCRYRGYEHTLWQCCNDGRARYFFDLCSCPSNTGSG